MLACALNNYARTFYQQSCNDYTILDASGTLELDKATSIGRYILYRTLLHEGLTLLRYEEKCWATALLAVTFHTTCQVQHDNMHGVITQRYVLFFLFDRPFTDEKQ